MEDATQPLNPRSIKWFRYVVLAAAVCFAVLLVLTFFDYYYLYYFYNHNVERLSRLTGYNTYLLKTLGVVAFIPLAWGSSQLIHPFNAAKRRRGYASVFLTIAAYNLIFFAVTRNQNFKFVDGESMRWYSIVDGKVCYYDKPGTDPTTGAPLIQITVENVSRVRRWERGEISQVTPADNQFFSTITGQALVWYSGDPGGDLKFFDGPGFDPSTRDPLKEITPEVLKSWRKRRDEVQAASRAADETRRQQQDKLATDEQARKMEVEAQYRKEAAVRNLVEENAFYDSLELANLKTRIFDADHNLLKIKANTVYIVTFQTEGADLSIYTLPVSGYYLSVRAALGIDQTYFLQSRAVNFVSGSQSHKYWVSNGGWDEDQMKASHEGLTAAFIYASPVAFRDGSSLKAQINATPGDKTWDFITDWATRHDRIVKAFTD